MISIFDIPPQITKKSDGPEPSLRELLVEYYTPWSNDPEKLANKYIAKLTAEFNKRNKHHTDKS